MSIHEALATTTLRWRPVRGVRPGHELLAGDESLGTVTAGQVELADGRLLRTQEQKDSHVLVDVGTGSRVASIRAMTNTRAMISAGAGRYRVTKQGVLPFALEVTEDLGGPQVLEILHLGPVLRVRAGDAMDTAPGPEVDLLVVLSSMWVLDRLAPTGAVAA